MRQPQKKSTGMTPAAVEGDGRARVGAWHTPWQRLEAPPSDEPIECDHRRAQREPEARHASRLHRVTTKVAIARRFGARPLPVPGFVSPPRTDNRHNPENRPRRTGFSFQIGRRARRKPTNDTRLASHAATSHARGAAQRRRLQRGRPGCRARRGSSCTTQPGTLQVARNPDTLAPSLRHFGYGARHSQRVPGAG